MLSFHIPDTSLIECLTKINRMDIVHLLEASTEPLLERASHSYAEMEQTITLDHSEGQAVCLRACACVCVRVRACVYLRVRLWLIQAAGPASFA